MHLSKDAVGCLNSSICIECKNLVLVDLEIDYFFNDGFIIIDDLPDGHIGTHLAEQIGVLTDLLDELQLLDHILVVLTNGDVLDVNENFLDGDVAATADSQLELHGRNQNFVHLFMGDVEFFLFIVDAVQQVLQIGYFRLFPSEVAQ